MSVIGILNCKMLQDEIVYLIERDSSINEIIVIENDEHQEFIQKLDVLGISYKLVPMIQSVPDIKDREGKDTAGTSLIVWNLELGLHEFPKKLKEQVYTDLKKFATKADGIYLLYGLCGNVLGNVEEDFKDLCPVVILRDPDGEIVDDCIGATIGGRRQYLNLLKSFNGVGTLIFTPMYIATSEEFFNFSRKKHNLPEQQIIDMNKFMFEASNYKRIAKLETGLHYTTDLEQPLKKFAETYDLEVFDMEGGHQQIFDSCYNKLKNQIVSKPESC
jgi:Protein of unknown function (DUF1638).